MGTMFASAGTTRTRQEEAGPATMRRKAGRPSAERPARRQKQQLLCHYTDAAGRRREVIARSGAGGSTLVIDRIATGRGDVRLVAHLACDEPPENARVVCRQYVEEARHGCRCRCFSPEDARTIPFAETADMPAGAVDEKLEPIVDGAGNRFGLERLKSHMSIDELRWWRTMAHPGPGRALSVREVTAALECYEPVCRHTAQAIAWHERRGEVSVATLRSELARVHASPIVLNRRLREAVLERVGRGHLSMSEIAIRCGRVKHDRNGNPSGETSWLARRLGILPEGGHTRPTPWIHSDVLGLIARDGLGVSPREVEL